MDDERDGHSWRCPPREIPGNTGMVDTHLPEDVPSVSVESNNVTSITVPSQFPAVSTARSFSKILPSTSFAGFADIVEMDVVQRLSKTHQLAEDIIEMVKMRDVSQFERAKECVEQLHPASGKSHFALAPIEQIMEEFGLQDLSQGLSESQVILNRELYGKNVLDTGKAEPIWRIYLNQFCSFVVWLLLTAAVVSLALGNLVEGIFIIFITNINAIMATYMEKSAANALEKLAELSSPTCTVIRGGSPMLLDSKEVVPGDVVVLKMGDTVAADSRLFDIMEIRLNEALLTGESESVKKTLVAADMDSPFSSNLCFASTSVTAGTAKAIVVNTGMNTQVGQIAKQLKNSFEGNKLTPLQRGLNRLGGIIGIISALVLLSIVLVAVITDYDDPTRPNSNKTLSIVLLAVGFAVSSIPEGLPMVVTISLSLGAKDMAMKNANIRKLPAVETLGCCSIICSDKTGTLTEGKMTLTTIVSFRNENGKFTAKEHTFFPTLGFNPIGGVFEPSHLSDNYKSFLMSLPLNDESFFGVKKNLFCKGSATIDAMHVRTTMLSAYLNSYGTNLKRDEKSNRWNCLGNMTECPLVVAAAKCGIGNVLNSFDNTHEDYKRIDSLEVPFNSIRKLMCTVHKLKQNNTFGDLDLSRDDGTIFTHVCTIKGAPDILFSKCNLLVKNKSGRCSVDWSMVNVGLSDSDIDSIHQYNHMLSSRSLRVLMLGIFPLTDKDIEVLMKCDDSNTRLDYLLGETSKTGIPLLLLGFVGSLDPPRHGVREAIATCAKAGVRVIMITGDQKATATAVANDIGLFNQFGDRDEIYKTAIECKDLHINGDHSEGYLPDGIIDDYTSRISVFCRAQPEDKVAIVESLKRQNYLTAMTGDGVNDAPALKSADIGVSMGINGTDVAKGASEMVLLDDNFCTIVSAIESGRMIYANIQKFVSFLLGTNIGEIVYLTVAIAIRTLPPVEALQILFLNFMTDGCPAVAISREPPDDDTMSIGPRPSNQPIMTHTWWLYGNIPHTIFQASMVICSILVALYLCTGVIFLKDLHAQCKSVSLTDEDGVKHSLVYFCKSYEYRITSNYTGWVTNISYYDIKEKRMKTVFGAAKGKIDKLTPNTEGLIPQVAESFKNKNEPIKDSQGGEVIFDEHGWCRAADSQIVKKDFTTLVGAAPPEFYDVTARKAMQARTMSFITAVFCETFRAYTVRSWDYFFTVFNRNPWMHIACSISITSTLILTIFPKFSSIMHVVSLTWWQYLIAIAFAAVTLILDECIPKFIYRRTRKPPSSPRQP